MNEILWTNDDVKPGKVRELEGMLELLDRFSVPGVFFVIPCLGKGISNDTELLRVIGKARENGHEFYIHGCRHDAFECGIPPLEYLVFNEKERRRFDTHKLEIEQQHTLEAQVRMIDEARREWRRAFGEESPGFRAPWCSTCNGFYRALDLLGFEWSSSTVHGLTWKHWGQGVWDFPVQYYDATPAGPYRIGNLTEYPIAADYALKFETAADRDIERMLELVMTDMAYYHGKNMPFNICSHWFDLTKEPNMLNYRLHEKMLPRLLEVPNTRFIGMNELHRNCQV
jgi:peptidoglycan/xylan/chitin deacetylase (PgdA/CDA1 family)